MTCRTLLLFILTPSAGLAVPAANAHPRGHEHRHAGDSHLYSHNRYYPETRYDRERRRHYAEREREARQRAAEFAREQRKRRHARERERYQRIREWEREYHQRRWDGWRYGPRGHDHHFRDRHGHHGRRYDDENEQYLSLLLGILYRL